MAKRNGIGSVASTNGLAAIAEAIDEVFEDETGNVVGGQALRPAQGGKGKLEVIPTKAAKGKKDEQPIQIPGMKKAQLTITLVGDTPLIVNKWSEKAKQEMRNKQMKLASQAKAAKDPEQCFRDSLYLIDGSTKENPKYGFPAIAFKSAAVDACSHIAGITKVEARGAFHIFQELVEIQGTPTMREDMVRVGTMSKVADLRYRGEFKQWKTTFTVQYNANVLSPEQIVNLFATAGFAIGVGEWRPEKNGMYGMFSVA